MAGEFGIQLRRTWQTMALQLSALFSVLLLSFCSTPDSSAAYTRCLSGLCSISKPELCNKSTFSVRICPSGCSSRLYLDQNATVLVMDYRCAKLHVTKSNSITIKYCRTQSNCNSHLGVTQDFSRKETFKTERNSYYDPQRFSDNSIKCLQSTHELKSVSKQTILSNSYSAPCTSGMGSLYPMCQIHQEQIDGSSEITAGAACSQDNLYVTYYVDTSFIYEYIYYERNCKTDFCTGTREEAINNFHRIFTDKEEMKYKELKISNSVEDKLQDEYSRIVFNDSTMIKAFVGFIAALFIMFVVVLVHSVVCSRLKHFRREQPVRTVTVTPPVTPRSTPRQLPHTPRKQEVIPNQGILLPEVNWEEAKAQQFATFDRRRPHNHNHVPRHHEDTYPGSLKRNMQLFVHFEDGEPTRRIVMTENPMENHREDVYEDDSCV